MHSLSIFISVPPCPAAELVGDLRCFQQHLHILELNTTNETLGIPRLWRTRYLYRVPVSREQKLPDGMAQPWRTERRKPWKAVNNERRYLRKSQHGKQRARSHDANP